MVGVFVHPELVIEPGFGQFAAAPLIGIATIGITFSLQASFAPIRLLDWTVRGGLAAVSVFVSLDANNTKAAVGCIPILGAMGYWVARCRRAASSNPLELAQILSTNLSPSPEAVSSEPAWQARIELRLSPVR